MSKKKRPDAVIPYGTDRWYYIARQAAAYMDHLEDELTQLRTERDRLREALSHYADKRNWRRNYDGTGQLNVFQADTDGPYIIAFAALHSTRQEEVEE